MKIMEWNINQRLNYAKKDMPEWIANVIIEHSADIVIITECFVGNNWSNIKNNAFKKDHYYVFESQNQGKNNDVAIAVRKDQIEVISVKQFPSLDHSAPDHLEINCKTKNDTEFCVVGMRIHAMNISNDEKIKELKMVLDSVKNKNNVIICGDFNNNRRGYIESDAWNLNKIDEIISSEKFTRFTPSGSSVYQEKPYKNDLNYEFPEDHFLVKGISKENIKLLPYNRDFVQKDEATYKGTRDFQFYLGKENKYDSVQPPYPDHAILMCEIQV